jgi:hypothetical protein
MDNYFNLRILAILKYFDHQLHYKGFSSQSGKYKIGMDQMAE